MADDFACVGLNITDDPRLVGASLAEFGLAGFSNERPFLGNGATFEMQFDSIRFPPPLTRRQRCKRGYPHVLDTMRRVVALLSLGLPDEARAVRAALWNTPKKKSKQRSLAHRMARALRQIDGRR